MKLLPLFLAMIFIVGCNPKKDIVNQQIDLQNKINLINHIVDSMEASQEMNKYLTSGIAGFLYYENLKKEREQYIKSFDSLSLELKKY